MKKILALALAFSATALLACPMKEGMMSGDCQGGMGQKCQCDTSKPSPRLEALGLSDAQKAEVQKLREEGKTFHNQQHDKMMTILTPDQQKKFEEVPKMCSKKEMKMKMPAAGMGCKSCDKK